MEKLNEYLNNLEASTRKLAKKTQKTMNEMCQKFVDSLCKKHGLPREELDFPDKEKEGEEILEDE